MSNTFIAPAADEVVTAGEQYEIRWQNNTPGPVYITLRNGYLQSYRNITGSTPNTGTYYWTPIQSLVFPVASGGARYDLQICDLIANVRCSTSAGYLTIVSESSSSSRTSSRSSSSSYSSTTTSPFYPTLSPSNFGGSPTLGSGWPDFSLPSSPESASRLSTDAKIAISAIVPFSALAVFGLTVFLLWRRNTRSKNLQALSANRTTKSQTGEIMYANDHDGRATNVFIKAELSSSLSRSGRAELAEGR